MKSLLLLALCGALTMCACLEETDLDAQVFPCRSEEDCIEGEHCEAQRFVCVPDGEGAVLDAGVVDGG